eukprot:gene9147-1235_t
MKRKISCKVSPIKKLKSLNFDSILYLEDYLFHIFSFFDGKDLNNSRRICKTWYLTQKNDYFIKNQCKILKIIQNRTVEIIKSIPNTNSIQIQTRKIELGYYQGKTQIFIQNPDNNTNTLLKEFNYKNNKKEGIEITYQSNKIKSKKTYKQNKQIGKVEVFDINEKLILKYEKNENEKYEGEFKKLKNGKKIQVLNFKNGKRHGLCENYQENGSEILSTRFNYSNGKKHGKCESWNLKSSKSFLEYSVEWKDGKKHGSFLKYFSNEWKIKKRKRRVF